MRPHSHEQHINHDAYIAIFLACLLHLIHKSITTTYNSELNLKLSTKFQLYKLSFSPILRPNTEFKQKLIYALT